MYKSGVSISTDDRRNALGYFAKRSRLLVSLKEEATRCSSYNVVNKKHIIKSERKLKGPLVLSYGFCYANAIFQSICQACLWRFTQNLFSFKCTFDLIEKHTLLYSV